MLNTVFAPVIGSQINENQQSVDQLGQNLSRASLIHALLAYVCAPSDDTEVMKAIISLNAVFFSFQIVCVYS